MIRIRGLSFAYAGNATPSLVLEELDIPAGEFVVVAGRSGSGKSTFARLLNGIIPHFFGGRIRGELEINGKRAPQATPLDLVEDVAMVFQNPDNQLVMSTVENEIAFGLENRGIPAPEMESRVGAALAVLGITDLRSRQVATLSGGEKQKVAIASAIALDTPILVLDEPTAELAPDAAGDILTHLHEIHRTLGKTIILVEHKLERAVQWATRLLVFQEGRVRENGRPEEVLRCDLGALGLRTPPVTTIALYMESRGLGVGSLVNPDAFGHLGGLPDNGNATPTIPENPITPITLPPSFALQNVAFAYDPRAPVLTNLSLSGYPGDLIGLVGPNGSGKTTLLKALNGLLAPTGGQVEVLGVPTRGVPASRLARNIGYVFQNPTIQFYEQTLREELVAYAQNIGVSPTDIATGLERWALYFGLADLLDAYPRHLSVGQQQRAALAAIFVAGPRIILLDEPTHGMDGEYKALLMESLRTYCQSGATALLVTHDVELIAKYCSRAVHLHAGQEVLAGTPAEVLGAVPDFEPQAHLIARRLGLAPQTYLTADEVVVGIQKTLDGGRPT